MKEIQSVTLEPARNAAHYELVHTILEFAKACQAVQENMQEPYMAFKLAVDEEGRLLGIALRSELTEKLDLNDRERDGLASGARIIANAQTKNPDAEISEAATQVLNQMISLKIENQANYMQQTGQIDILLDTLLTRYAEQVEKIGIAPVLAFLKASNDRMHELLNQRDVEQAPRTGSAMEDARSVTDAAFRAFIKFYNAWILVNANSLAVNDLGTTQFSTEANSKIEYFKRYVLKTTTSSKPEDIEGTTPPGEEETPPTTNPPAGDEGDDDEGTLLPPGPTEWDDEL